LWRVCCLFGWIDEGIGDIWGNREWRLYNMLELCAHWDGVREFPATVDHALDVWVTLWTIGNVRIL
jgi:hypothetical protein